MKFKSTLDFITKLRPREAYGLNIPIKQILSKISEKKILHIVFNKLAFETGNISGYDREKHCEITRTYNPKELTVNVSLGGIITNIILRVNDKMQLYMADVFNIIYQLGFERHPENMIAYVDAKKNTKMAVCVAIRAQSATSTGLRF